MDACKRKLGVPNLTDPRQQAHLRALYYLTKSLDNTRLVIDNDGWEHTEVTDLFAIHDYTRTGKEFQMRFQNVQASQAIISGGPASRARSMSASRAMERERLTAKCWSGWSALTAD